MKALAIFATLAATIALAPLAAADLGVCAPANAACTGYGLDHYKGAVCVGVGSGLVQNGYVVACGGDWGCSIYYDVANMRKGCSSGAYQALAGDVAYEAATLLP